MRATLRSIFRAVPANSRAGNRFRWKSRRADTSRLKTSSANHRSRAVRPVRRSIFQPFRAFFGQIPDDSLLVFNQFKIIDIYFGFRVGSVAVRIELRLIEHDPDKNRFALRSSRSPKISVSKIARQNTRLRRVIDRSRDADFKTLISANPNLFS